MRPALIDNSAWARLRSGPLSDERREEVAQAVEEGSLWVCLPFLLEAGYSARSGPEHNALMLELGGLPFAEIDAQTEALALQCQHALAKIGHHRLPPVDLLIAALATRHGLAVLHYDGDYDLLRDHGDLQFESIWLAPRGSL